MNERSKELEEIERELLGLKMIDSWSHKDRLRWDELWRRKEEIERESKC